MTAAHAFAQAPAFIDPGPAEPIFPVSRARAGTRPDEVPTFGQMRWELSLLDHRQTVIARSIDWARAAPQLRGGLKRAGWAMMNLPTPEVLRSRNTNSRPTLSAASLYHALRSWTELADWADAAGLGTLGQITASDLEEFAVAAKARGRAWATDARVLADVSRLWAFAPFLPPEDRLVTPPWEAQDATASQFLGEDPGPAGGENATAVIHPSVMSPLLVWSIRMVHEFAPDILAAKAADQALRESTPERAVPGGIATAAAHLRAAIAAGRLLPSTASSQRTQPQTSTAHSPGQRALAAGVIGGILGVNPRQVSRAAKRLAGELRDEHLDHGAPVDIPITGRTGASRWVATIDHADIKTLTVHLSTATLIIVAYLSGMRPDEVLHLERGCCTRRERPDGTVRYLIAGRYFKDAVDEHGNQISGGVVRQDPWVVNELVHQAIAIQQELTGAGERYLFPRRLSTRAKPTLQKGEVTTPGAASENIARFVTFVNSLAARHERRHEMVPSDPDGAITLRRFRRTLAWFIYRRPGGRIALGVQYGHIGTAVGESYAGRSKTDMLHILDYEKGLAMADTLTSAADRLASGEGVSGPAAERYIAAAREFDARYAGGFTTSRGLKALRENPRLQLLEHPRAILTCTYDPFKALCIRKVPIGAVASSAPDPTNCDPTCTNIARTDTHIDSHRSEIENIDAGLAAGLAPRPLAERQRQRRQTLLQIIARHEAERIQHSLERDDAR